VNVAKLVKRMDGLLRRALGEDIEIEVVPCADLWQATVDPTQLESALLNLSLNARDAMPQGGRLSIDMKNEQIGTAHGEMTPGEYVLVCVSDTGTGMTPEVVARAFEPFFSTKQVGKGSGLGLSMVYGFVKQTGGHIEVHSECGHGSTFRIYLPRAPATDLPAGERNPRELDNPMGSETILVVEDDDLVRAHTVRMLLALGYQVLVASNGPEAVAILERGDHADLLFTDLVMPGGMGGRQLADRAAALRPLLKVLFTTGYAEDEIVHHGRPNPGIHLMRKPYRQPELALKLRQLLGAAPPC
jgi:CheY-like chemotaxis protein